MFSPLFDSQPHDERFSSKAFFDMFVTSVFFLSSLCLSNCYLPVSYAIASCFVKWFGFLSLCSRILCHSTSVSIYFSVHSFQCCSCVRVSECSCSCAKGERDISFERFSSTRGNVQSKEQVALMHLDNERLVTSNGS